MRPEHEDLALLFTPPTQEMLDSFDLYRADWVRILPDSLRNLEHVLDFRKLCVVFGLRLYDHSYYTYYEFHVTKSDYAELRKLLSLKGHAQAQAVPTKWKRLSDPYKDYEYVDSFEVSLNAVREFHGMQPLPNYKVADSKQQEEESVEASEWDVL